MNAFFSDEPTRTLSGFPLGSEADNAYHRLTGAQVRKSTPARETPPPAGRMTLGGFQRHIDEIIVNAARQDLPEHLRRVLHFWKRRPALKYWTLTVEGAPPGTYRHYSRKRAEREAVRLVLRTGRPVVIHAAVACAIPLPAPAPEVEIIDTDTGRQDFYNHPQEVCPLTHREKKDEAQRVEHWSSYPR